MSRLDDNMEHFGALMAQELPGILVLIVIAAGFAFVLFGAWADKQIALLRYTLKRLSEAEAVIVELALSPTHNEESQAWQAMMRKADQILGRKKQP